MLDKPLELLQPGCIRVGANQAAQAKQWLSARNLSRPIVIADAFNAARLHVLGLEPADTCCISVRPEPDLTDLNTAVSAARDARPDAVIGFGGGSAMDVAKLVSVMIDPSSAFEGISGLNRAPSRDAALLQIPTTAGTGSEAGTRALVTEPGTQRKIATESPHMLADMVILDPELTISLPAGVTAATGIDALAHCVEAFTSRRAHPVIDHYALEGIRLVGRFLPRAVRDGGDLEARAALLLASFYGGVCLGPVNTTAGHAVAYPLGTRHHLPHGLANALIFPHVLAANAEHCREKTAHVAEALGLSRNRPLAEAANDFCTGLGLKMRLRDHAVPENDLPEMAGEAHAIRRLLDYNPRDLSRSDILALYRAAY
ncbi:MULTISPECIES: iron-containing alcohol dehydrogenase family protein [unclassified Pannonibacter]|uniref:iron-containing alcohol dehydrogenase family protein n=1 Tax=unclassified Pannonibacter TaxID=2627228 RepID=UPI0016487E98|nr:MULTISPECIES: iron-containing alcohol dehydrogenase [unclassified Pannonibacter]